VPLPAPQALAQLSTDELVAALAPLFENSAAIARSLVGVRFSSWDEVMAEAAGAIARMSRSEQVALLSGHARLGEDPGRLKAMSRVSFDEQHVRTAAPAAGTAPDGSAPDDVVRRALLALGQQYEERFGFPFVEFVAGRPLADIVPVLQRRLTNTPEVELDTALRAVVDIAADRAAKQEAARQPDGVQPLHGGANP
jgi:2-oxo-4-hydroxy-4-carboxy--5-ureidoimidazoline (OHCU) decarboxylase